MSKALKTQRWFAGWGASARAEAHDAADYGTAFGLDMSLPDNVPPAAPRAQDATRAHKPGWIRRLNPRAKTLA